MIIINQSVYNTSCSKQHVFSSPAQWQSPTNSCNYLILVVRHIPIVNMVIGWYGNLQILLFSTKYYRKFVFNTFKENLILLQSSKNPIHYSSSSVFQNILYLRYEWCQVVQFTSHYPNYEDFTYSLT